MQLLAPIATRVIPGRTIDIVDIAPDRGVACGFARVDLGDPVFFDHPLDHVPGMLLAVAGLELADHASMLGPDKVTCRLTFTRFCELGERVQVRATREAGGTSMLEFIQSGRGIVNGSLTQRDTQPLTEYTAVPALRGGSVSGQLVHRADRHNIAIGPLTVGDGRVWTRVRKQAAINELPPRASAVASILEAARQFTIAILHLWGRHPSAIKMIFVGLTAEVPTATPLSRSAQALSWHVTPREQTRKVHIDMHEVGDRATKVGSIVIATRCVDEDEYARLRAG